MGHWDRDRDIGAGTGTGTGTLGQNFFKKQKNRSSKSFLNLHFMGFGAISRSRGGRVFKTVHFGIGDVPKCPTDDRFMKILVFFAIFVGRWVPFFGHSLLSYSKRRHLSTFRVIPLIDCHQSLYPKHRTLSTFLPDLCFIWQSHRFQFLGCALPIGLSPSLIPAT